MNTIKGAISNVDLLNLSEEERLEGWNDQSVCEVQRMKIGRENGDLDKIPQYIFASTALPESLETGYTKLASGNTFQIRTGALSASISAMIRRVVEAH